MNWEKAENLYADLDEMARKKAWSDLELHFFQIAEECAGTELARLIQSLDLENYISQVNYFLKEECRRLSHHAVKALYFEYDPDHSWNSNLFICDRYSRSISGSEAWIKHWIDRAVGPDMPELASLYKEHGSFQISDEKAIGVTFFLIARTVAAFGKALSDIPTYKMAVCIGHFNQKRITRIFE